MTVKVGVIVDGYSTGSQVAAKLHTSGIELVHVKSSGLVPPEMLRTYRPAYYREALEFDGDLDALAARLRALGTAFVAPGTESGVNLSEDLAARLGLPGNDCATVGHRSNKARMGEALLRAGVPCAGQVVISHEEQLSREALDGLGYPLVVKPTESAGSDDVLVARGFDEAAAHVRKILGQINKLGRTNREVLVQEFLHGQQYIVNSVSLDGEHCICEIWKDSRVRTPEGRVLYDYEYLVSLEDDASVALANYARKCLDAMGVRFGPVHAEMIFTVKGPRLVEIGARCQGGILGETVERAIGNSHVSLTAKLLSDPDGFRAMARELRYSPRIMVVALNSHAAGVVEQATYQKSLGALRSFSAVMSMPNVGDHVVKTEDLFSSLGAIYLVHDDFGVLLEDLAAIRAMEKTNALLRIREAT
jgi:biotin carboxylase